jgi:hypothetical protein
MSGLSRLRNMFRVPDLRNKVFFTIFIIFIFRIGSYVPVPYVDFSALRELKSQNATGALGFLDLFSGGALTGAAVFALGIMPYITSSIIMQLLGVVIPKLEEWQNEGPDRPEEDHAVDALPDGGARADAVDRAGVRAEERSWRLARPVVRAASREPEPDPELHRVQSADDHPHVDCRYRAS